MRVLDDRDMLGELARGLPLVRLDLAELRKRGSCRAELRIDTGRPLRGTDVNVCERARVCMYADVMVPVISVAGFGLAADHVYGDRAEAVAFAAAPLVRVGAELLVALDDPEARTLDVVGMKVIQGSFCGSYLFEDWKLAVRGEYVEAMKRIMNHKKGNI